jgi:hypothetical protein
MTSKTNKEYTDNELALMLKYGSLETAELYWWGRQFTPEEQWEVVTLKMWQNKRDPKKVG